MSVPATQVGISPGGSPTPTDETADAGVQRPAPAAGRVPGERLVGILAPVAGILLALGAWALVTEVIAAPGSMLAQFAPAEAARALWTMLTSGTLLDHAAASVWRLAVGLTLAVVVGVLIGLAIGSSRLVELTSRPVVMFLRMVSPLSWAPVAIGLFGVGDSPVIALVFATAVWPVVLSTTDGVRRIDPQHLRVARLLDATHWEQVRSVVWPSIQPALLGGIRLAIGIGWVVLVPAEMLGVTSGLGYEILNAKDQLDYGAVAALILVIGPSATRSTRRPAGGCGPAGSGPSGTPDAPGCAAGVVARRRCAASV